MEEKKLFREKSLTHFSSPEQMTDYLKVTGVGVWLVLTAIIVLLLGAFAWSATGTLETVVIGRADVSDGVAVILVSADIGPERFEAGQRIRIGNAEGEVSTAEYAEDGRTVVRGYVAVQDGRYRAEIVTERIRPITFLIK